MIRTTTFASFFLAITCFCASVANCQGGQTNEMEPQTVAESSEFKSTSRSAEVVAFVKQCDQLGSHVRTFTWGETVEGRPLIGSIVSTKPYEIGDQDDRNVVLLLGNIHSGECAGKEALLMMLRELAHNPNHPWLKKNVILFAPNYNADGNDRVGKNNRPGQAGPVNGMGQRENAQQLDLNRDFSKVESPEARALVKLIDTANPHLFVDCHTTNGSRHQYSLTYDIPHNPATAEPIRNYLRNKMMPKVTQELEEKGQNTFYYGNFNRDHTSWTTYGYEPRYSTEYVGLRGRFAILSEAYSYLDYKGRIFATKDFVSALLDFATEESEVMHKILDTVEDDLIVAAEKQPERVEVSLGAKVAAFPEKFMVKGYKDGMPFDYACDFIGNYQSTKSTTMPYAYIIPEDQTRIVDRLLMHGVRVERLAEDFKGPVTFQIIKDLDQAERAFQRHKMVRVVADSSSAERELNQGHFVVRTNQRLAKWVCYMLEAESDDGFAFWNFLDNSMEVGKEFPILRLDAPVELSLENVESVTGGKKITLGMIDGPNNLLANAPKAPRWFGQTNWLKSEFYGREILMDAENGAWVSQPARPYQVANVKSACVDAGLNEDVAEKLSSAIPLVATTNEVAVFSSDGYAVAYYIEGGKADKSAVGVLANGAGDPKLFRFNDDESMVSFATDSGLHFYDIKSRKINSFERQNDKHLIGQLDWVYQEELYGRGNFKGYWWQTGGNQVAFLKLDESPLFPFTVMDHMPVRGKSEFTNYPKAGDPNPIVSVGVLNCEDMSTINWVDLEKYKDDDIVVAWVSWTADGKQLLLQIQNREQTWLDLVATDADGSNQRVLFRDSTPAWIESPGDPVLLNEGRFLWRSPRTGYSHIYQYDASGKLIGPLTSGEWEVRSLIGVDPAKEFCFITATKESAREVQCYSIKIDTGEMKLLTEFPGSHSVSFSHDYSYFVDSYSDIDRPTKYFLRNAQGELIRRLHVGSDDRLKYLDINTPEFLEVPSANDQPLDAMLIKPPNFDPEKKYPVLVHIYAGPQAPRVMNRFGGQWYLWHQMLAQQGYVVWMCDNQSASYRSVKNAWPIHRNMAQNELADIERGVEWLKQQSWVDQERIGIWGWSYGGYMTAYALTRSQSFKMGISGAPVTDWKNYDSVYTERYMGTPQNNPEGYKSTSVLYNNAENLHGKLLLIHGTIDDNVHLNNTIQFVKELQYAGKQFELMLYPSNRHSVRDKKQSAHLRKLMTDFVLDNL